MKVPKPQMTQEKTCGFVVPRRIERMYGANIANVRKIADALRTALVMSANEVLDAFRPPRIGET